MNTITYFYTTVNHQILDPKPCFPQSMCRGGRRAAGKDGERGPGARTLGARPIRAVHVGEGAGGRQGRRWGAMGVGF